MRLSWREFRQKHADWDFEARLAASEDRANLISKFKYVWRAVGTDICKQFNLKYVKYEYFNYEEGKKIAKPLHFIFVLDHSHSMRGRRWEALADAFRAFLKQR